MKRESAAGILLIITTAIALYWSNSPWAASYFSLWETPLSIGFGDFVIKKSLLIWINDGLMAMFFFVVGLEIKREIIVGELSSFRLAALPIAAALGGIIVPAGIYAVLNLGGDGAHGWGIPMATDIAFALGILTLFGKRVPAALKIFLAALAIVDDLGAVLVIAFFYTSKISLISLGIGAIFLVTLITINRLGVRNSLVYAIFGIGGLWLAFLLSGVHPTIAGVLAALCIPAKTKIDTKKFIAESVENIEFFKNSGEISESVLTNQERQAALLKHKLLYDNASTPLQRLEKALHPWVIYFVMPIFALANAGVTLSSSIHEIVTTPVGLGIILGLVLGKQLGITAGAWLAVKANIASLPKNVSWSSLYGVSCLGGIGFTMSLFIASLAFKSEQLLSSAKIAILCGSLISALIGCLVLWLSTKKQCEES